MNCGDVQTFEIMQDLALRSAYTALRPLGQACSRTCHVHSNYLTTAGYKYYLHQQIATMYSPANSSRHVPYGPQNPAAATQTMVHAAGSAPPLAQVWARTPKPPSHAPSPFCFDTCALMCLQACLLHVLQRG